MSSDDDVLWQSLPRRIIIGYRKIFVTYLNHVSAFFVVVNQPQLIQGCPHFLVIETFEKKQRKRRTGRSVAKRSSTSSAKRKTYKRPQEEAFANRQFFCLREKY